MIGRPAVPAASSAPTVNERRETRGVNLDMIASLGVPALLLPVDGGPDVG
jgi:hypothetical protein